jgi:hypothetical protein
MLSPNILHRNPLDMSPWSAAAYGDFMCIFLVFIFLSHVIA